MSLVASHQAIVLQSTYGVEPLGRLSLAVPDEFDAGCTRRDAVRIHRQKDFLALPQRKLCAIFQGNDDVLVPNRDFSSERTPVSIYRIMSGMSNTGVATPSFLDTQTHAERVCLTVGHDWRSLQALVQELTSLLGRQVEFEIGVPIMFQPFYLEVLVRLVPRIGYFEVVGRRGEDLGTLMEGDSRLSLAKQIHEYADTVDTSMRCKAAHGFVPPRMKSHLNAFSGNSRAHSTWMALHVKCPFCMEVTLQARRADYSDTVSDMRPPTWTRGAK